MISSKKVLEELGISRDTFQKWKTKDNFPSKSKQKLFDLKKICEWIIDNMKKNSKNYVKAGLILGNFAKRGEGEVKKTIEKGEGEKVRKENKEKTIEKEEKEKEKQDILGEGLGIESALERAKRTELIIYSKFQDDVEGGKVVDERVLNQRRKSWLEYCDMLRKLEESYIDVRKKRNELVDVKEIYAFYYEKISSVKVRLENIPNQLMLKKTEKKLVADKINFCLRGIFQEWGKGNE